MRVNTLTGLAYKDDPTIFAWELMNEPRCPTDLSGETLQVSFLFVSVSSRSLRINEVLGFAGVDNGDGRLREIH